MYTESTKEEKRQKNLSEEWIQIMDSMEKHKDYADKLKSPKWQRKRLEVFQRDGWKCTDCYSTYNQLQVHHKGYLGNPWDVRNELLVTLCDACHEEEENKKKEQIKKLGNKIGLIGFMSEDLKGLNDAIDSVEYHESNVERIIRFIMSLNSLNNV